MPVGIYIRTKQHRLNLSKALKGNPKLVGRVSPMLGKKHSAEANMKNCLAHLGKKHSECVKAKIRSKARRREASPTWRGGRYIDRYVLIYMPDHPHAKAKGYVYEHRLVMEKYVGRYLNSEEFVHHINGIKTDNRIENLQLTNNSEHLKHHIMKDGHIRWRNKK